MNSTRLRSFRVPVAIMFAISIVLSLVFAATPVGAQGLQTGDPGDLIVFIDRDDIPANSTCTVRFENNQSSHPGNVASVRSSLERVVEADFEDGSGETVELTIESDGMLFAAVRLGETGGTSTSAQFVCVQSATTTTEAVTTTVAPTTTAAPATTEAPETTVAPTTTAAAAVTTAAPTTAAAAVTTTTEAVETEVLPVTVEQPEVAQLAVTGRTQQAALGFALVAFALGMLLVAMSALEPRRER